MITIINAYPTVNFFVHVKPHKRIDYAQSVITFELMRDKKLILNKS